MLVRALFVTLDLSKTADPGFLRKFHFSGIGTGVLTDLLGEVELPPWMEFSFGASPDPTRRCVKLGIDVQIRPRFQRKVPLPMGGSREEIVIDTRAGRRLHTEFSVTDMAIRECKDDLVGFFREGIRSALLAAAHRLYEFDPRMGWCWTGMARQLQLPTSRLFDPPGPFSRTGVPLVLERDRAEAKYRTPEIDEPRCPFCREPHKFDDPPLWAGGNLLWVHTGCWRRS